MKTSVKSSITRWYPGEVCSKRRSRKSVESAWGSDWNPRSSTNCFSASSTVSNPSMSASEYSVTAPGERNVSRNFARRFTNLLFRKVGYEATTVQQITDGLGIAKGTFFNHFSSRNILSCAD